MDDYDHAAGIVRDGDHDRYLADLFAPMPARKHLFALHAFNVEVARLRDVVSEPGLGEIRLQFWRDALHGDGSGHPVARALVETIRTYRLPMAAFDSLLEARRFDLYDDPMPSLNDLEGYAGDTSSSLIQLAALILGGESAAVADLAGHGGVAYALTGLMRALPVHAARGQIYLPGDLLAAHEVDQATIFSGEASSGLLAALAELRNIARRHLQSARGALEGLDPAIFPAVLPLALVEPELDRMDRPDYRPFTGGQGLSRLRRQWILWRAARRRTF